MFFQKKNRKDRKQFEILANMSIVGIHLVTCTFVGLAMGYFLDKWLGTKPWGLLFFLIFGIAAGFKNVYMEVKKLQDQDEGRGRHDGSH
ncbi:AtpZ/AtpI family protein [Desulfoplanes sp. PS50]|jgi:ATP synthase protein I